MLTVRHAIPTLLTLAVSASFASAQTGPGLLFPPLPGEFNPQGAQFAGDVNTVIVPSVKPRDGGDSFTLTIVEAQARGLVLSEQAMDAVAYAGTSLTLIDGNLGPNFSTALNHGVSVGGKWTLDDDWSIAVIGGIGHAGTKAYRDSNGIYGMADLIAIYRINEDSNLLFGINYNGSRSIFPDIPLPGVVYSHRVSDQLDYAVGIPQSLINWRPTDAWKLSLAYRIPFTVDVDIDYALDENWTLYTRFENRLGAFHEHGERSTRRAFVRQRRIEAGVRYQINGLELMLGGGYAFDQEVSYGFDIRNDGERQKFSDEPYIRVGLSFSF